MPVHTITRIILAHARSNYRLCIGHKVLSYIPPVEDGRQVEKTRACVGLHSSPVCSSTLPVSPDYNPECSKLLHVAYNDNIRNPSCVIAL